MGKILLNKPELLDGSFTIKHLGFSKKVDILSSSNLIRKAYKAELNSYANLRNAIVHSYREGTENKEKVIALPLESEVKRFENLANTIMMPPKAYGEIVIPKQSMYYVSLSSKVNGVIKNMDQNKYSYVPILQEDKLHGVFSQDTLFSYIANNEGFILDENLEISEFGEILNIDNHTSEKFEFISRNCTIAEVEMKFSQAIKEEKRLEVIFVTENGLPIEKILGLSTVWDLVQYQSEANNLI